MKYITSFAKLRNYFCLVAVFFALNSILAQTVRQEKMEKLNFMVGDWVGISSTYQNDTLVKQVPAHQNISFKLSKNIITIDLQSETLQLHTVIYYDEKEGTYYYNPYYEGGAGRYVAEFKDGKFIVSPNKNKRFIFHLMSPGNFQEYGEKFENGKWVKYFEDNFQDSTKNQ